MKLIIIFMMTLVSLSGCSKDDELKKIEREESFGKDDFRETDTFERTVPVDPESKKSKSPR